MELIVKYIKELNIGDVIILRNNICKLTKVFTKRPDKVNSITQLTGIGIFNDIIYEDFIPSNHHIQLQILQYGIFDFVSITKKRIELYDETTNTLFDIDILLPRDEKYISIINNNKYSMKIQLVQFENFSKIVNVT